MRLASTFVRIDDCMVRARTGDPVKEQARGGERDSSGEGRTPMIGMRAALWGSRAGATIALTKPEVRNRRGAARSARKGWAQEEQQEEQPWGAQRTILCGTTFG